MYIEIRKTSFVNKGAELMLLAILARLNEALPNASYVMAPGGTGSDSPYRERARLGLYQKAWLWRYGLQLGDLAGMVPRRLRDLYGVVLDKEVRVVLDAAGFAYGDQWSDRPTRELARACRRWRRNGTKVLLLPQAFGPFTSRRIRSDIRAVVDNADLICAREARSYRHLVDVVGERSNIKIYPDFTNLLDGVVPETFDRQRNRFAIVPNYRMIDKVDRSSAKSYLPFLINVAGHLKSRGAGPFLLIHEGEKDRLLAEQVAKGVGGVPIIPASDPLAIKGILGTCRGTVSSRFHGLVSALSQGVPSLGTGWSHKYEMLFADYGVTDGVLAVDADVASIQEMLDVLIDGSHPTNSPEHLRRRARQLKADAQRMWDEVLGICRSG